MSIPRSYRQMPGTCIYVCECICVFTYHCLIVQGRRRCPRGPALSGPSGPVRPVCSVRALGPRALERTGRTGPDRTGQGRHRALAKSSLALSGPVRSSGPLQWLEPRTLGPDGPDRTGQDPRSPHLCFCFCLKSDGVVLQNKLLDQK